MNKLYIGTSGYSYKHWKEVFYPKGLPQTKWLSFYVKYFNTVEINATFYGNFKKNVFVKWAREVPEDFKFCLKGPRFITHVKRLKNVNESLIKSIKMFFDNAKGLEKKLNIVLWQFPKSFKFNEENLKRLEYFLSVLEVSLRGTSETDDEAISSQPRSLTDKNLRGCYEGLRYAFEFRDESWFNNKIYELINKYNATMVIPDSPYFPAPTLASDPRGRKLNFYYIRFHGSSKLYSSEYTKQELKAWAKIIKKMLKKADVYCYFNNDSQGFAIKNALELKKLLKNK